MKEYILDNFDLLTEQQQKEIYSHIRGLTLVADTYIAPDHGWTCFHCGETFYTESGARLHFGKPKTQLPICQN